MLRKGKVQEAPVIYTGFQSAGGPGRKQWESEKGSNILMSVSFPLGDKGRQAVLSHKDNLPWVCDFLRTGQ
jgi:biotin-(acetyl-CoA carboxylase) ligase